MFKLLKYIWDGDWIFNDKSYEENLRDAKIKKEKEENSEPEWYKRHINQAKVYRETHKAGTKVIAKNKSGVWKEGEIIGEHDWELWHFFFTIKFNDGEFCKVQASDVTKVDVLAVVPKT